jgi:hypothetical protein
MTQPSAFQATFSDFKNVKTRKTLQLIFEVPTEMADAAIKALGGFPDASKEVWVAIARLDLSKPDEKPADPKHRRRFSELPYSQQAAMRCNEPDFWRFLNVENTSEATDLVRHKCDVVSRKDIIKGSHAGNTWEHLEGDYYGWQHGART